MAKKPPPIGTGTDAPPGPAGASPARPREGPALKTAPPDLKQIFESVPACFLVLAPDAPRFTILAATDSYLEATKTERAAILGKGVFEVFPDNPEDPTTHAVDFGRASFERVVGLGRPDVMGIRRHDIRRSESEGGGFEVRFWDAVNFPVTGTDGNVACIIHRVEDVTAFMQLRQQGAAKEAANALREGEEKYRRIVELAQEGIMITDSERRITFANRKMAEMLGHRAEEMIGRLTKDFLAEGQESLAQDARKELEAGKSTHREFQFRCADGTPLWVISSAAPVFDESGRLVSMISMIADITERKRAEDALRRSEEMFAKAFHGNAAAVVMTRVEDGRILDVNEKWLEMGGFRREEVLGKTAAEHGSWKDPADRDAVVRDLKSHGFVRDLECDLIRKDGREYTVLMSAQVIKIHGEPVILASALEITGRKRAEHALAASRRKIESLVQASLRAVAETSVSGLLEVVSDAARALTGARAGMTGYGYVGGSFMLGFSAEEPGSLAAGTFRVEEGGVFMDLIEKAESLRLNDQELRDHPAWWGLPNGHMALRGLLGARLSDAEGKPCGLLMVTDKSGGLDFDDEDESFLRQLATMASLALRHIEGREHLERRVAERTAELSRRADQLRALSLELTRTEERERRRLAEVLHDDLQQLLVAAKMRASVVADAGDRREIVDVLAQCIVTSRSLTQELSPPILYDGDLPASLEGLARRERSKHGLEVVLALDPSADPGTLEGRLLLFRGARELLLNVVKHAGVDRAELSLSREGGDVRLSVADAGVGFDQERGTGGEGGGIGLFGLRERLEPLGGSVVVASAPGRGAHVTLVLPVMEKEASVVVRPGARTIASGPMVDKGPSIRLLVVDDHTVVRQGLVAMLAHEDGIEVVGEASDGQEALEVARRCQPDAVIMDVNMPRMNGLDATRALLAEMPHVRVVGLSVHAKDDMEGRFREAGACAYLDKSGPAGDLIAAIRNACRG